MAIVLDLSDRSFRSAIDSGSPTVTRLFGKLGDRYNLEVILTNGATVLELPDTAVVKFGIKQNGALDGGYLVLATAAKQGTGADTTYVFDLDFNTVELRQVFTSSPSAQDRQFRAEIEVYNAPARQSSRLLIAEIEEDLHRGDESEPTHATPAYPDPNDLTSDQDLLIDDGGNSSVVIPSPYTVRHTVFAIVEAGEGEFTHIIVLPGEEATGGQSVELYLEMPASANPTIEVRNGATDGTLLFQQAGDGSEKFLHLSFIFRTSAAAWKRVEGDHV